MPIRRAVNSSTQETAPKNRPADTEDKKAEPDASSEESASTGEEQETETPPATSSETEQPKEAETDEEKKAEGQVTEEDKKNGEKEQSKEKEKKVKKTIPSWATLSASQRARAQKQSHASSASRPKMDAILTEAIKACFQKSGASVVAIRKYIISKYPSLELERRGFLLKQALKRELQRGAIRQVKGKGASGSFVVVSNSGKSAPKSRDKKKGGATGGGDQTNVKLEDILPLAFTRLCEPKEASYSLIKKYVSQYYPKLKVDVRPQLLKNALQRAVEKGQLEQITGKGASGTFQLKRAGDKPLLSGGGFEDAILSAITAMNEPKTCSTTAIKKYVLENHPGVNSSFQVHLLKRTLQKCEKNGWMEQISGKGFSGTYQLSFPYYPSPYVLFPDKAVKQEDDDESDNESEEEEEEESEEEESEEEEPPPKRRMQKKAAPSKSRARARAAPPKPKKSAPPSRGKAKSAAKKAPPRAPSPPPPAKAKKGKAAPPPAASKKAAAAAAPPPAAKKPAPKAAKKAAKPAPKGKPSPRKSLRSRK